MSSTEQQLEAAAQRMAEGMGYDWLNIDIYNMGSTLVQADSGFSARAGFMKLARLAIGDAPSFDQLAELYAAQAHEVVGLRAEIERLRCERDALGRSHKDLAIRLADSGREFERLTRKMDAMRSVLRSVTCPRPAN